jgi:ankyrin repeat protein
MKINRKKRIISCLGIVIALVAVTNGLLYPDYFRAPVNFKWAAQTEFSEIYVFPPHAEVGSLRRFLGATFALEARPFISSFMRKSGWQVGEGQLWVNTIPFPPIVIGLNGSAESTLIDPKVTPLMKAADRGDLGSVNALLHGGADVNSHDQRGWTPLMHASKSTRASSKIIEALITAGADVNAKDRVGRTALICAYGSDAADKVRVLIGAHADPNAKSNLGETPLEQAVDIGATEAASELLSAGADPNARVLDGKTALAIAVGACDTAMADLLRRSGAKE